MVAPEGFVMPPLLYLVPLVVITAGVAAMLWAIDPPVTDRTVLAFVPWFMFGAVLHVYYKFDVYHGTAVVPDVLVPLLQAPAVYLTTAILLGQAWIICTFLYAGGLRPSIWRPLAISGTVFFVVFASFLAFTGWDVGAFDPFWPVIAVVLSGILAAIIWVALSLTFTDVAAITGWTGMIVVFSHVLDAVTTAVGVDILDAHEAVPASRAILRVGELLPTADVIGVGWLFVVLKVGLALVILGLFTDFVQEYPKASRLVLAGIAAVGLGPGTHNAFLFLVTGIA